MVHHLRHSECSSGGFVCVLKPCQHFLTSAAQPEPGVVTPNPGRKKVPAAVTNLRCFVQGQKVINGQQIISFYYRLFINFLRFI